MNYLFSSMFFLIFNYTQAQVKNLEKGVLYWTGYYVEWELSDKFHWDAEVDNRRIMTPSQQVQTLARTTFFFKNSSNFNIGAGLTPPGFMLGFNILPAPKSGWN